MSGLKRAFTLMEVNLAIFIMATGVLAMVSLYSLGFRESRQSVEDVASASFADGYLAPLVMGLSATNMLWTSWTQIGSEPQVGASATACDGLSQNGEGWGAYVQQVGSSKSGLFRVTSSCNSLADQAFNDIINKVPTPYRGTKPGVDSKYYYGLVVTRTGGTISLAFRASRRRDALMSQPIYYTEVHFQGVDQ